MLIVGIDPGKTSGGIGWLCTLTGAYGACAMPQTTRQIYLLLSGLQAEHGHLTAISEQVQVMGKKMGVKSAMSYGQGYGELIGCLTALNASIIEIRPAVWKKALKLTRDKADSILLCERLYPEVNLFPGRCTKGKDGIAEAMLLAHYGRSIA